jgi:glycosyltransferase involved in cell wall biosynthesis
MLGVLADQLGTDRLLTRPSPRKPVAARAIREERVSEAMGADRFGAAPAGQGLQSEGRRVSLVIPAKNEARNIGWVLERVPLLVDEIVLVDRSTDATVAVARAIRPDVVVVTTDRPGKGIALRTGFEAATGDYVVMIDADGSMDPLEIPRFIELLDRGFDLVKGSRFLPGAGTADMSLLRDAGNKALLIFANVIFGASHSDLCYGFAAFRRDRVLALGLTADGFEIETQLFLRAFRSGLAVGEVPSFESPRRSGTSNLNTFRDGRRVLSTILAERTRRMGWARGRRREHQGVVETMTEAMAAFSIEPGDGGAFPFGGTASAVPVERVAE